MDDSFEARTYICGNPPYAGSARQSREQKSDVQLAFGSETSIWRSLDYVCCWFKKASDYAAVTDTDFAFVTTNSVCQGEHVPILWPIIFSRGFRIKFAHTSFKWQNLAAHNAGVTVSIVGISKILSSKSLIFATGGDGIAVSREVASINAYLVAGPNIIVYPWQSAPDDRGFMIRGNMPTDGGHLLLDAEDRIALLRSFPQVAPLIKRFVGAAELINSLSRYCLWIEDKDRELAATSSDVRARIEGVRTMRLDSSAQSTRDYAKFPHRFRQIRGISKENCIVVPRVSSENREYLPVDLFDAQAIVGDGNFAICDSSTWNISIIASRLHWVWIGTVCVRLEMRFSYSNTLGWNTFPVPPLTDQNKADLTRCAESILLAREAHFPATIAELYDPESMPDDLRRAHDENDEVLERIYIGRRFRNDTERLEKLFELYTKTTARQPQPKKKAKGAA